MKNVITQVRQKQENGSFSDLAYIGTEQRFIPGLRGTNVNNLEEQFLTGCDSITEVWTESNKDKILTRDFRTEDVTTNFYRFESTLFANVSGDNTYVVSDSAIYISTDSSTSIIDEINNNVTYLGLDPEVFNVVDTSYLISPKSSADWWVLKEENLYFVRKIEADGTYDKSLVLTRTLYGKRDGDKIVNKIVVENKLKEEQGE